MRKILCVFGTRPEAVKMAPVIRSLREQSGRLRTRVCVTAQHRGMLDDVLKIFRIRPDHDLNVMQEGQSLEQITKAVIERLPQVLRRERPDLVLVHGDTSTTFLAALASFYARIPVGHVEAGLRSHDYAHPFPEEANRRLADALCTLHFAPTPSAKKNLLKENISAGGIFVTGNSVIDALHWAVRRPRAFGDRRLRDFLAGPPDSRLVLVTAHRRENFGRPLEEVCAALKTVADRFPGVRIVYPVHLNPNVQSVARKTLSGHSRILLLPPLDYLDMSRLIQESFLVVTDSGGLQEEAPSLGKPVLVLRKVTERPEAVAAGTAKVIGTGQGDVVREISRLLQDPRAYRRMAEAVNPYGDGAAARRITEAILWHFGLKKRRPADFIGLRANNKI